MQEVPDGESSVMPSETQTTEAVQTSAVQELLSSMTLEEKVWQMFIITPEQLTGVGCATQAGQTTAEAVAQMPVGGVIYFSQNLETPEQTTEMLTKIQQFAKDASGIGLFLAVDEEGGLVARCADKLGTTALSDMAVYGARNDAAEAYEIGQTLGSDIGALGFNLDFAPVA
ncbi:MAG: glycoside hydrolase family 3, partial [Oscillospiraceae bacterium]|nr:glycoside hydrolase family 3 [Oscillospiraceae bacterium]